MIMLFKCYWCFVCHYYKHTCYSSAIVKHLLLHFNALTLTLCISLSLRMTKTLVLAFCLILSLLNSPSVCPPTSQSIGVWRLFLQIFAKNIFAKLNVSKNANKRRMRNFETFTFCVSEWVCVCTLSLWEERQNTFVWLAAFANLNVWYD